MTDVFRVKVSASELAAIPDEQIEPLRSSFNAIEVMRARVRQLPHDSDETGDPAPSRPTTDE